MTLFAQRRCGDLGGLCFYETFRTETQRGFGGDCASMTLFAQRSSGVLGGLCFYETFRTKKQRVFFGGDCASMRLFAQRSSGVLRGTVLLSRVITDCAAVSTLLLSTTVTTSHRHEKKPVSVGGPSF